MIDTIPSNDLIDINIVDISNLSVRAKNVLQKNNILSMLQLIEFAKTNNLQDLRNSGVKTTNEIYSLIDKFLGNEESGIFKTTKNSLVDDKLFSKMDTSNYKLPIYALANIGVKHKVLKTLNQNGYNTCKELQDLSKKDIIKMFGKSYANQFLDIAVKLEKSIFELLEEILSDSIGEKESQVFLRRSSGETLAEVATNIAINSESPLTRERIRQIEKKFLIKIKGFLLTILEDLRKDTNYILSKDIIEIYDNDDFDRILLYGCKLLDEYEFLDFADVFLLRTSDENVENKIFELAKEFVGNGLDLYEHIEDLEEMLNDNQLDFISIGEFINLLKKYNYNFYRDYISKDRATYGKLCVNLIRDFFPDGIKLSQGESTEEPDLIRLRNLANEKYGNLNLPSSDRSLSSALARSGLILYDRGRYIPISKVMVDESILQEIKNYIDNLESHKIFYMELFSKFKNILSANNINNYNFLHGILALYYPSDYSYSKDYLEKNTNTTNTTTLADRIYNYIMSVGKAVHKNEIKENFSGFSDIMILMSFTNDKRLIQWNYNYYTSIDLFDITKEDKDNIGKVLETIISEHNGYASSSLLFNLLKLEYPSFIIKNKLESDMNLYYIVSSLFSDKYDFKRPHIVVKNKFKRISTKDLALHFLHYPKKLSYTEFLKMSEKMSWSNVTSTNVFSEIEKDYIRISRDEYISKDAFTLQREHLDNIHKLVVNNFKNDIFSLLNYDDFSEYPNIGYEWNEFILGSIIDEFIDDIVIIQSLSKDRRYQKGIAVKKSSGLNTYQEIIANVLIANNIQKIGESQLLSFLISNRLTRKVIPIELRNSEYIKYENNSYEVLI